VPVRPPAMPMIGASARIVGLDVLGQELGLSVRQTRQFVTDFGVEEAVLPDGRTVVDLFALELAWHRRMRTIDTSRDELDQIEAIGTLYEGQHRAALLARLREMGEAVCGEIVSEVKKLAYQKGYDRAKKVTTDRFTRSPGRA
jgi:hypothetical protein